MAFLDHEGHADFPFPRVDVLRAIARTIPRLSGMEIASADELTGRIVVKAGVSLWSWGESISITASEVSTGHTRLSITSAPKTGAMFGGAMDMGKNRQNIETIIAAVSNELACAPMAPQAPRKNDGAKSASERLSELKSLHEAGLITDTEYQEGRASVLAAVVDGGDVGGAAPSTTDTTPPVSQPSLPSINDPACRNIVLQNGRTKTIDATDVPYAAKQAYQAWVTNPGDSAKWEKFLQSMARQIPNMPRGRGAAVAMGSFFPEAWQRADFRELLSALEIADPETRLTMASTPTR